jgi:hypothetical protein
MEQRKANEVKQEQLESDCNLFRLTGHPRTGVSEVGTLVSRSLRELL